MKNDYGPVLGFFILVFVLSIPFWLLGNVYSIQLLQGLPIGALGVFAPALAAIIMAYRSDSLKNVRQLLGRLFDLNRIHSKYWYLVFVLFNPVVAIIAYVTMRLNGITIPRPSLLNFTVLPLFAFFFVGALAEEIGWTGFATESLLRRLGTIPAGLLLGLIWAVFHLVVLSQANRSLEWIAWWSLGTLSFRTLMVWLYDHAGKSVFAAAVFHAMINLSWQLFPVKGSFYDPRLFSLVTLFLVVIIIAGQRFLSVSRRPAS